MTAHSLVSSLGDAAHTGTQGLRGRGAKRSQQRWPWKLQLDLRLSQPRSFRGGHPKDTEALSWDSSPPLSPFLDPGWKFSSLGHVPGNYNTGMGVSRGALHTLSTE